MSKFTLIGGGVVSGTGLVTGATGLAVMGINESESDLMRKKLEIDDEKMKLNKEIQELSQKQDDLQEKLNNKANRENAARQIQNKLSETIDKITNKLKGEECWELGLDSIRDDNSVLKDEGWVKELNSYTVDTGCKNCGEWYMKATDSNRITIVSSSGECNV